MKFLPALFVLAQSFVAITYAAPAIPAVPQCIQPDVFKDQLFNKLQEDLGEKFVTDFNEAYKSTIKLAQFDDDTCYDYLNGQFLCKTLKTIYSTRIPEAVETVVQDCDSVLDELYPVED